MGKSGAAAMLFTALLLYGVSQMQQNPTFLIVVLLAIAGVTAWAISIKIAESRQDLARLESLGSALKDLSKNLKNTDAPGFSPQKDEMVLYYLPAVALTEFRSTGASYSGGSQGVSIRIAKGVSYRVGANRGQLTKNPEQMQVIDQGSAIFTNTRILFAGSNVSREWDLDKMINVDMGPNGVRVTLAVSNRQKNSGLMAVDTSAITPGFLAAMSIEAHQGGLPAAKKAVADYAKQISDFVKAESTKKS